MVAALVSTPWGGEKFPARDSPGSPLGELLCFAEREFFGFKEDIRLYGDATKTTELLRVKARQRYHPSTTYDVTEADGTRVGVIQKIFGEQQYCVSDASDTELMIAMKDSIAIKQMLARLLSGHPLTASRFVFWRGNRQLGSYEASPSTRTESTVDMTPDHEHIIDRRLGLAVSCLDVLRVRPADE